MSLYVVDNENSIVHIFRIGIYKYKISLVDNVFEINKSFFGLIKSNIFIEIDSFKYNEGDVCFYLYNKKQRVSVVLTNDPEIDCVDISNDTGKSINLSTNKYSDEIFKNILEKIRINIKN